MNKKKEHLLLEGKSFITKEKGNSMHPKIKSGQLHRLVPAKIDDIEVGDIVYCKVRQRCFTHYVKAIRTTKNGKEALIGNAHGAINGWTSKIFGKVTEIFQ
jgi:phage-related protein